MKKRRTMHWFWRTTIASLATCIYGGFSSFHGFMNPAHRWFFDRVLDLTKHVPVWNRYDESIAWAFAWVLPYCLIAFLVYGVLTSRYGPRPDRETRCRKCGYILRGISEPRCSECGERI